MATTRERGSRKVLLIGWDAADWKIISPLLDAGHMPELARFVESGVMGNLATLYPDLSPMLWTSIATGMRPYKHGVLGFVEPDPHTGATRPISVFSRKTKALWNIMSQEGKRSIVVGWWPSHPAEPINGVMVSNHYKTAVAPHGEPWPMAPGTVHPHRLHRNLAELRQHPQDADPNLVQLFLPKLAEIDQEKDHRVEIVAKNIAECTSVCNAATAIMHHEPWDFAAVYFDAIDHFCHGFMKFHPPRLPWVDEKGFELYQHVVQSAYIYHDILLGRLLREVDENTTVILISDHGFHSDHLRPDFLPKEPAGPAAQHRHFGVFAARGPNIKRDQTIFGASLLDVCPTILSLFRLPIGEDMDGKPLINIFEQPPRILTIPSWETVRGRDGRLPEDVRIDPVEAAEAMKQLVELGYIEEPPADKQEAVKTAVRELHYNCARSYMDGFHYDDAARLLEALYAEWPGEYRFGVALANCRLAMEQIAEARRVIDQLLAAKRDNSAKARERLKELREEIRKNGEDAEPTDEQADELRALRAEASYPAAAIDYLAGSILLEEGDKEQALEHLNRSMRADAGQVGLHVKLGEAYCKLNRLEEARTALDKALELDQDNSAAWLGMAECLLRAGQNQDAAEAALNSLGLIFHNPKAHFLLGVALTRLGQAERAVNALNLAVAQNPNFARAWAQLAYIYKRLSPDPEKRRSCFARAREAAHRMRRIRANAFVGPTPKETQAKAALSSDMLPTSSSGFRDFTEPFDLSRTVIIVTGLPRSGTSMMMQMLEAGGVPALSDAKREADSSNPRGYYEHELAKQPAEFKTLLAQAGGKAVKIVAQLVSGIPAQPDMAYRFILMERDLDEIIASQGAMLARDGKKGAALDSEQLADAYAKQLSQVKRMLRRFDVPTLLTNYNETIADPRATAERLRAFLGESFDLEKALAIVDPKLYREKNASGAQRG